MATKEEPVILTRKPKKELGENIEDYEEEERVIPPDGGWGWIIVLSGFFAHVLSDGVMYAFGVVLDELLTVYEDVSTLQVTFVGSLLPAVILGVGPIASTLITLFGARAITIAGSLIAGVSLMVAAFSPNLIFLSICIGVFVGFGFGIVYLPAIVMVSYYFERRRSIAMGLTVVGSGIGTVAFPPLLRYLIFEYGWRGTLFILGAIVFNCIACGLLLLPLKPTKVWVKKQNIDRNGKKSPLVVAKEIEMKEKQLLQNGNNHKVEVEVTSEQKNNIIKEESAERELEVRSPLLEDSGEDQKAEKVIAFPEADQVKFRRGFSHSMLEKVGKRQRNFSETDNGRGPISPRSLDLPRQTHHTKLVSLHQSQLLPEQRNNPDLITRPDLRYPSSLTNIPLYMSNRNLYVQQIATYTSEGNIGPEDDESVGKPTLWVQMVTSLKSSFDFTLFKDIPYFLFCFSSFMTSIGYNAPYLFMVAWGNKELGFEENSAALLSSFIGIGNITGRLVFGYMGDFKRFPRLMLYSVALTLCGAVLMISPFHGQYWWMVTIAVGFGFFIAGYIGLTPLLLVDLLGLHRLEVAFGIIGFVQCIATIFGPPLLAWLRDRSGSFALLFYGCGAAIAISGLMLVPVYFWFDKLRSKPTTEEIELGRAPTMTGAIDEMKDTQQTNKEEQATV